MTVEKDNWKISGPAEIMGPWPRRLIKGDRVRLVGDERILTVMKTPGTLDKAIGMRCEVEQSIFYVHHQDPLEMVSREGPTTKEVLGFAYAGYGKGANCHGTLWVADPGETTWTLDCHRPQTNDIVSIERMAGWWAEIFFTESAEKIGLRSLSDPEAVMLLSPEVFNQIVWLERRQRP